jgi:trehalose/maltose hydrolase-like predicted phosphorylase
MLQPWESAFTGQEVCPDWAPTGKYEQHITGDIAFAFKQYWDLTHDLQWLLSTGTRYISEQERQ